MEKLATALDKLSAALPLDGKKTEIFLALKGLLPLLALVPFINVVAASEALNLIVDAGLMVAAAMRVSKTVVRK